MSESILITDSDPLISEQIRTALQDHSDLRIALRNRQKDTIGVQRAENFTEASRILIRSALLRQPFHVLGVRVTDQRDFCEKLFKLREHSPVSEIFIYETPEFFSKNQELLKELLQHTTVFYLPLSPELICSALPKLHHSYSFHKQNRDYLISLENRITDRTASLNGANQKLRKITREKENLVRILCHDLSNSISLVKFCAERGASLANDPDVAMLWEKINRVVKGQTDLVDFVREVAAVTAGKVSLNSCSISLKKMFDDVEFVFGEKLREKNLSLVRNLSSGEDITILADPVVFANTILNNLVSNAIKFSPKNSSLHLRATQEKDSVVINLKDHGIGIPDWLLKDLFDSDKKTSRAGTEGERGTGFGMPLVKSYVEALGGSIKVESKDIKDHREGHGTLFTLTFPVEKKAIP